MVSALRAAPERRRLSCPLARFAPRATVHAEGDRECRGLLCVALQLSLFDAAAAPPDLTHLKEAARSLVDVHDAVCADCVLVHHEQPVRVGVLLLRAVELFHTIGGLLEAQAHATQELLHQAI